MKEFTEKEAIQLMLDWKDARIRIDNNNIKIFEKLASGGYCNRNKTHAWHNWKTSSWNEPDPIYSRFEILDL